MGGERVPLEMLLLAMLHSCVDFVYEIIAEGCEFYIAYLLYLA